MTQRRLLLMCICVAWSAVHLLAQESTVYFSVVATKLFVVGAANPRTGVHLQHPTADTAWTHIGPNNIRAFGVAVHPGTGQQVIYIAAGNGLHKSSDGGKTWRITTGWNITEVLCVCPDPRDVKTVYLACAYGIFRSTDGCASWTECNSGLGSTFTTCVLVDNAHPGTVYCASEDGAYVSTNSGSSWSKMGLSVAGVRTIAQNPSDPDFLMVGTESNGIYFSANGGKWVEQMRSGHRSHDVLYDRFRSAESIHHLRRRLYDRRVQVHRSRKQLETHEQWSGCVDFSFARCGSAEQRPCLCRCLLGRDLQIRRCCGNLAQDRCRRFPGMDYCHSPVTDEYCHECQINYRFRPYSLRISHLLNIRAEEYLRAFDQRARFVVSAFDTSNAMNYTVVAARYATGKKCAAR